ncbi:Hsp70 protein that interacts with Zuo1p [Coemansia sp. RSA 1085]|nr:Hsp70 protein that interacts with Zuo1p [Coemansia sp. RSA 1085]
MATYIGLSLGTDNSVIAIINKDQAAEVIANEDGEHKTPTYIAFSGEEEYHGSQAKHQIVRNAQNTIRGFGDMLGQEFSSELAAKHEGYARIENKDGAAEFVVHMESEEGEKKELRLTAHEAMVRYLRRLRTTAEEYLGRAIEGAVVSVPVGKTKQQHKAIEQACEDAGLQLLQLVEEPIAVAMQYGAGQDTRDQTLLVVDVGGTGTDVSVVTSSGGLLAVAGSAHTGEVSGQALDMVLATHFAKEFQKQSGVDVLAEKDPRPARKLLQAVELTKRTLSAAPTAPCAVESLYNGMDFSSTVSRTRFDILANKVYAPLASVIDRALENAGYTSRQIDQVLLSGGAARVRKLQMRVALMFPESTSVRDDAGELDELAASGCAAQAALIAHGNVELSETVKAPVLARPVGLQLAADQLVPVLLKNTPLPASRSIKVALPAGEKRAYVAVSEGEPIAPPSEDEDDENEDEDEGEDGEDNEDEEEPAQYRPSKLLAEMVLELDAANAATRIEVTFFADANAKLTVTATEPQSGKSITAEIPPSN